jgi:hypothetical protein
MSTIWEVPVATADERAMGLPRRMFRELESRPMPRDARPSRARHERLPAALRTSGASSHRRPDGI